MRIHRGLLSEAAEAGVIPSDRVDALWQFLQQRATTEPDFRLAHVIYYLGGLIAVSAMTLFVSLSWHAWAGLPMLLVALVYAAIGIALTHFFLNRAQPLPAGLAITFAVLMTPLAGYSIQEMVGWWDEGYLLLDVYPRIDGRQTVLSLATTATAAVALRRYRLPLLMLVLAGALWYLLMDVLPFMLEAWNVALRDARRAVALVVGLLFIIVAIAVDAAVGRRIDYALWWYVVGVTSFWGGLTAMDSTSEWGRFFYFCVNVLLLLVGAMLGRRVFAVFAFVGIVFYLYHLADYVFRDSLLFPVVLAGMGLAILFSGLYWQRHEARIHSGLRRRIPGRVADLFDRAQERES